MDRITDWRDVAAIRPHGGPVQTRTVYTNGVNIAFKVQGEGPPLVLIIGYRLNSSAWPQEFIEALARRFTVITLDNRGTGRSGKPLQGYALDNLARDVRGLLDELGIERAHILGYSMGGAIAQEFVRQFPERVAGLVLCATICGGGRAIYAKASVLRVMRDLDGLRPEEIARRIWKVTYSPNYLARNLDKAERQMLSEIAEPTPLHAADLQFQAFSDFDVSDALAHVRAPTLVLTGEIDELVPPGNSKIIAELIPGAELHIFRGVAHRLMWEAPQDCSRIISEFLHAVMDAAARAGAARRSSTQIADQSGTPFNPVTIFAEQWRQGLELMARWPLVLSDLTMDMMIHVVQPLYFGRRPRLGDGKPVVIATGDSGHHIAVTPFATWLKGLGYRPVKMNAATNDRVPHDQSLAAAMTSAARRTGRKAVIIAVESGLEPALRAASSDPAHVSAVIALAPPSHPLSLPDGVRVHAITTRDNVVLPAETIRRVNAWPGSILANPDALLTLSEVLREIEIELLEPERWKLSG